MSRLFEDWGAEAERPAWKDLIDQVELDLKQTAETHGEDSIEGAGLSLILGSIHFATRKYKNADPFIRNYIFTAEEKFGLESNEVLSGLILFANNCIGSGRVEESRFVLERVKFVAERCFEFRDPLLESLYKLAQDYQSENQPKSEQRSIILFLLALSWCVRYPRDHNYGNFLPDVKVVGHHEIYALHIPQLKAILDSYGFRKNYWEWLIRHCNNNLTDLVGLISILHDQRLIPIEGEPPLTAETREESLASLVQKFPVPTETDLKKRILQYGEKPLELEFVCPLCGSQDLRTKFLEPYHPVSTLDRIKVDPKDIDLCDLEEREPSEFVAEGHSEGWEFWCDKCGLSPYLEPYDENETQVESLARWLLDNCPQDDGLPVTETAQPKE